MRSKNKLIYDGALNWQTSDKDRLLYPSLEQKLWCFAFSDNSGTFSHCLVWDLLPPKKFWTPMFPMFHTGDDIYINKVEEQIREEKKFSSLRYT